MPNGISITNNIGERKFLIALRGGGAFGLLRGIIGCVGCKIIVEEGKYDKLIFVISRYGSNCVIAAE